MTCLHRAKSRWKRSDIRRARQTRLKPVLEDLGYQLQHLRNGNYLVHHLVAEIVVKDHFWVCKDNGSAGPVRRGGNAIDFLVEVQSMSFNEAMQLLRSYPEEISTTESAADPGQNYPAGQSHRMKQGAL